ncbi:MAG: AAA family ATPase [Desulfobacterales bacterium]|nr:AAA family ATPase [Desulfobacterales bacterium]
MDYFSILDLHREPFSNSPDPEFFFQSRQHQGCLQRLELALRLRRGLNVIIGDVGTGKTTLCRQLIRKFSGDPDLETHLILDPDFSSPADFLQAVAEMFDPGQTPPETDDPWQLKEKIKNALFQKGVDQKKTVVLIIDEGQKLPGQCLELLREFLNYETNEHKLLQIAIFAQPEFERTLESRSNFADRINLKHVLGPMDFRDTRDMIRYRLSQSSEAGHRENLFTLPGLWAVYRATGGYPRKIIHLCHQCLLAVIIQNRRRAGWALVRSCGMRAGASTRSRGFRPVLAAGLLLALAAAVVLLAPIPGLQLAGQWTSDSIPTDGLEQKSIPSEGLKTDGQRSEDRQPNPSSSPAAQAADSQNSAMAASDPAPESHKNAAPTEASALSSSAKTAKAAEKPAVDFTSKEADSTAETDPAEKAATKTLGEMETTAADSEPKPPEFLGTVVLQSRETLWRLVEKVYGVFEEDYLQSIRNANPQIRNPKRVEVGVGIRVPAIPTKTEPPRSRTWWIRLEQKAGLNEAIDVLRSHPEEMPPIRVIPHWHPSEGLAFSVLLKERFTDRTAAGLEVERLKTASGVEAELVSDWKPDTVFYADPYRG